MFTRLSLQAVLICRPGFVDERRTIIDVDSLYKIVEGMKSWKNRKMLR
jgi:hypothetical protein